MAGTYYHQEALRKARLIERKTEAIRRLQDSLGDHNEGAGIEEMKPSNLVFSEAGHYAQNRSDNVGCWKKNEVVFEEVVHDPNFKYRLSKDSRNAPVHVDPIYKILYPGGVRRQDFSKYPPEQTPCNKFFRRHKEDIIRKPTPDSVKKIPRDQIYGILHPNR